MTVEKTDVETLVSGKIMQKLWNIKIQIQDTIWKIFDQFFLEM